MTFIQSMQLYHYKEAHRMDFKQVYLTNGQPYLAFRGEDGEYQYPKDEWTETPPPAGGYQPMHFDGNKWVCATREEWLKSQKPVEVKPDATSETIAQLLMNDLSITLIRNVRTSDCRLNKPITSTTGGDYKCT